MQMIVTVDAPAVDTVKALAEPLRWQIVQLLADEELCVCHLVEELDVPQPLVSHHLKVLRDAQLVESSRFRYWTYYRLRTGPVAEASRALSDLAAAAAAGEGLRRPCC